MKLKLLLLALSALQAVLADTLFTDLIITDVDQGPGACIRMPQYTTNATAPVTDLTSSDIACGYNGTISVFRVCKVEQGGVLTFKFQQYPDNSRAGVLASSEKGPCSVYMKYVDSAIDDPGAGSGWFKIYEEGYDKNSSQWCTDTLIQDNGLLSVAVPIELAGGYYLVRPELMTLPQGDSTPSFYTGCAQIFLDSGETTLPNDVVSIPGYIQAGDPTLQFDISAPVLPYTVPGPSVYVSNVSPTIQHPSLPFQNVGVLPSNAVLTNGNWFGVELSSYSAAEGCSNVSRSHEVLSDRQVTKRTGNHILLQPIHCLPLYGGSNRNSQLPHLGQQMRNDRVQLQLWELHRPSRPRQKLESHAQLCSVCQYACSVSSTKQSRCIFYNGPCLCYESSGFSFQHRALCFLFLYLNPNTEYCTRHIFYKICFHSQSNLRRECPGGDGHHDLIYHSSLQLGFGAQYSHLLVCFRIYKLISHFRHTNFNHQRNCSKPCIFYFFTIQLDRLVVYIKYTGVKHIYTHFYSYFVSFFAVQHDRRLHLQYY
ncbi:glycoside hydrolase family 61 protein [Hyaloscypha variabilis F]|uniref:AA9 family lytic polysaccharide monooxygenase n=1 Tax=Hyaloscypha variabilis (strain UAMH 11265 / GT02V1 / F) TaxID=1149755 RepID=A0A2J6RC40_HYAVF|nr:glycoside hydrolase family 61 protein [Hyaloscypha variabilis F]